ncbi:MAG: TonB-dependent receptor [Luteolibacter sp.]
MKLHRRKIPATFPLLPCGLGFLGILPLPAQTQTLPEMVVLASRTSQPAEATEKSWHRADLREAAPRTLDELLAREPSFSLYRRQNALFGNPTSAGVSLRNTGATAASRTLVLLDGIPQNDPFGGWVYWARYQPATLDSVSITSSASAAVWGSQSPAGVIQMSRRAAFQTGTTLEAGGGSHGLAQGSLVHQTTNPAQTLSAAFSLFGLRSDGFHALDTSQRGAVDRKLDLELAGTELAFAWKIAPDLVLEPVVSLYQEKRGNGTEMSRNSSDAIDLSLRLTSGKTEDTGWQATLWHQRRSFASVFSSVSADRSSETLALDQYDVPATATGGSWTARREWQNGVTLHGGADLRHIDGETRENVGTFRHRVAGGQQTIAGIFLGGGWKPDASTHLSLSGRLDAWRQSGGRRVETSLTNGEVLKNPELKDRDGIDPSFSLELTRKLTDHWQIRLSSGTGFRLPTLNELYRPFRVRNDITEANAALDPERFVQLEGGVEWKPTDTFRANAAIFHHWISDAIANVPVTDPAEISEIFGPLPAGGTAALRQNVDEARVLGIEGGIEWLPVETLTLSLQGIWTETEFTHSRQRQLEGKPFSQAPGLKLVSSCEWRATPSLAIFAGYEYGASQYDDTLASRRIGDYTSTRLGLRWTRGPVVFQIRLENLFDEAIQTGLSGDGIRTYAAPRTCWVGISSDF